MVETVEALGVFSHGGSAATLAVIGSTIQDNETGLPARGGSGSGTGSAGSNGYRGSGGGLYIIDSAEGLLRDSTIGSNRGYQGSGIYVRFSTILEMTACTISGNVAEGNGGGVLVQQASELEMNYCTVSGNNADGSGGGIYIYHEVVANLEHVTITGNTADMDNDGIGGGGGLVNLVSQPITVTNSIIAQNYHKSLYNPDPDCYGLVTSGGYNLFGIGDNANCTFVPVQVIWWVPPLYRLIPNWVSFSITGVPPGPTV